MFSGTVLDKDLRIEKFECLFDKKDLFNKHIQWLV